MVFSVQGGEEMAAEQTGFYHKNMELLEKNHPHAWEIVRETEVAPAGTIVTSSSGEPNLKVDLPDRELFFHDVENPSKEGDEFLAIVPENARGAVVFRGMGLGYGPLAVIENRENIRHLIVFELCVEVFLQALAASDLSRLLSDPRVIISLGENPDVGAVFSSAALSMRLEETSMLTHNPSCQYEKEGYEALGKEIYSIANSLNISANTFKSYGSDFISNRLSFLKSIHHNSLIDSLKGKFKDVPAVLVAGGPSLNRNIQLIREFKDRAVIISADTALPALLANGVVPDFVSSIDYKNLTYEKIASSAPVSRETSLICSSWVAQKVAKIFPAQNIYWTFTGSSMESWINQGLGGNIVTPGAGTVAHLNLIAAIIMECSPVIFTGQDLSYSEQAGAGDHVANTVLTSNDKTAMMLKNQNGLLWVEGNNGGKVPTSRPFMNYLSQFENMIEASPGTYINATEGGAFIKGTEVMPLKEVLARFCFDNGVSEKIRQCNSQSRMGNIDGFLGKIKSVLKTVNDMKSLIKKGDKISGFLKKELLKLQNSSKRCASFNDLSPNLQKKIKAFDKCHDKLDKKHWL